jgi:putative ABC transport system permease protein
MDTPAQPQQETDQRRLAEAVLRLSVRDADARDGMLGDLQEEFTRLVERGAAPTRPSLWYLCAALGLSGRFLFHFALPRGLRGATPFSLQKATARASMIETVGHDLRCAVNRMRRSPGFYGLTAMTLGLGIGLNIAIFSVVHAVLLRPLPYRDVDRLVNIFEQTNTRPHHALDPGDLQDLRDRTTLFEEFGARHFEVWEETLTGGAEPIPIIAAEVSLNLFALLGTEPVMGRTFVIDDVPSADRTGGRDTVPVPMVGVMVSHGLWQRQLGADPGVIGRTMEVNKRLVRIVGVMPQGFTVFPPHVHGPQPPTDIWFPEQYVPRDGRRGARVLRVWARLKRGVTTEQAQAEVDVLSSRLQAELPEYRSQEIRFKVLPAQQYVVEGVRPALLVLLGAVGSLLLLVCANVTNLLLVRARMRSVEMSIRGALGGSRGRLAWQSAAESLVLAVAGGIVGLALAWLGIRLLLSLQPASIPRFETVSINGPVLACSTGISAIAAVLFGVLPSIQAGRVNLAEGLKSQTRGTLGGRRTRLLASLVVIEVALSMVLLLGAGAMLRTFVELQSIRPGFEPRGALTFHVVLYDGEKYGSYGERVGFFRELEDRIRALPGVDEVGSIGAMPFTPDIGSLHYAWDEESAARFDAYAYVRMISRDYFRAMRTRMLAGRLFSDRELTERKYETSVIVDETVARRAWPDEDPIGKYLIMADGDGGRARMEVVGVVEHVPVRWLLEEARGTIYVPHVRFPARRMHLVVRGSGDLTSLVAPIRTLIRELDPGLALTNVTMLEELVDDVLAPTRFTLLLMSIFAGLALVIAAVGLYGVIAFVVGQRTAEIGMRMALGADRLAVLKLVVGQAVLLIVLGAAMGVMATLGLSRFVESVVYGVSTTDLTTLIVVALVLTATGMLASYVPARRAMSVDPLVALRRE